MTRKIRFAFAAGLMMLSAAANAANMTVMKSPTCGCCAKWIEHARANGFAVKVVNVGDIMAVKAKYSVPANLVSCHTALVNGYIVEGHVPAADIKKLLAARPKARGIAVAGMPMGSPGMEHGGHREAYNTMLIKADGNATVLSRH